MNRRSAIKAIGIGSLAALAGGGVLLTRHQEHPELALELTLVRLTGLDPETIETTGVWSVARTLNHLAQSIEFSMTGYPVSKSKVFQHTAGLLAFSVFQARGQMTHSLVEPIPGEIALQDASGRTDAMHRLTNTLNTFDAYTRPLKPHFAYGELSKSQYALAHVMHINNHFEEFTGIG